jgi:hypothetical protein
LGERDTFPSDETWRTKGNELFTKLLYEMAQALGYDYDEVQLRRDCYRPEAHGYMENTQLAILSGLESLLKGKISLPMAVTHYPGMPVPDGNGSEKQDQPAKITSGNV